ncbi:MAG: BCCT family transporter, partial [Dehalococcoidia bacterium]
MPQGVLAVCGNNCRFCNLRCRRAGRRRDAARRGQRLHHRHFGWYYTLLVTAFVVFAVWVGLGHNGDIKLAPKDDEEPEFKLGSWFSMLFACG